MTFLEWKAKVFGVKEDKGCFVAIGLGDADNQHLKHTALRNTISLSP